MPKRAKIKKIFLNFLAIFSLGVLALVKPLPIFAFFGDSEKNPSNLFQAGRLDFSLSSPSDFSPEVTPDQRAEREITLHNEGNPFIYQITTSDFSGDLCDYLLLETKLGEETLCQENLITFSCQDLLFSESASSSQTFSFQALLLEEAPEEASCQFKFIFSGRQLNLPSGGFHDTEEILNTITSGRWRINLLLNKIYYDVDSEHGNERENEWLEIYNLSEELLDISGWQIEDNGETDVIPPSPAIPPHGFALISGNSSTWNYWEAIPDDVVKIVLEDGDIGNGLANDGDRIILKDSAGRAVDQMSYEGDTSIFEPAPPLDDLGNPYDLPEGHILGRDPVGYDTDTAQDWHDFGLPQVTVIYPTGGTWGCRENVTLRWQAQNPNGPDAELAITLLYIRDIDRTGTVSNGDAVTVIAQDIVNTGSYNWQVYPCYYGYVWIKVIAKGPENFMVHSSALSGRVYEPDGENSSEGAFSSSEIGQNSENATSFQEIVTENATSPEETSGETENSQENETPENSEPEAQANENPETQEELSPEEEASSSEENNSPTPENSLGNSLEESFAISSELLINDS
jgi:hypothetical protein